MEVPNCSAAKIERRVKSDVVAVIADEEVAVVGVEVVADVVADGVAAAAAGG